MFRLLAQGPDDNSTYSECFGSTATSDGRLIGSFHYLKTAIEQAMKIGHNNFVIMRGKKIVMCDRKQCREWLKKHGTPTPPPDAPPVLAQG